MESYREFLEKCRREYKAYKSVYSPALEEVVIFNSKGFNHLLSKEKGIPRERKEQKYKLSLLSFVTEVIRNAELNESNRKIKGIEYWSVVANVGKAKIRVVLRKIGSKGKTHFWSVMRIK